MLQQERHEQILARLNTDGKVKVKELAVDFEVTEDCIRKDLTSLEKEGIEIRDFQEVFAGKVDIIIDGGPTKIKIPSTIIRVEDEKNLNDIIVKKLKKENF